MRSETTCLNSLTLVFLVSMSAHCDFAGPNHKDVLVGLVLSKHVVAQQDVFSGFKGACMFCKHDASLIVAVRGGGARQGRADF